MIRRRRKGWPTVPAEQAKPRTLEQRLRQEIYVRDQDVLAKAGELVAKARRIADLEADLRQASDSINDREEAGRSRDRRIAELNNLLDLADQNARAAGETIATKAARIAQLELVVRELGLAAVERQERHQAKVARLLQRVTDPGLPTPDAATSLRITTADPERVSDDLYAQGWGALSSAGQTAAGGEEA